jgi:asparagine synthase (glutamine-hydrolysing)
MCGIAGALELQRQPIKRPSLRLLAMNRLQQHRGPDGSGIWVHPHQHLGLAHRRLSIIDLDTGAQPMHHPSGNVITYNGEIYNYLELREELREERFVTESDTEVILHAYQRWGTACLDKLRGMFALAIWDESSASLFCARDRCGIKPFYYTIAGGVFYFASEIKALLPFVERIETDSAGLQDYLSFQFCLESRTLFANIHELPPGHCLTVKNGHLEVRRYWQVYYDLDFDHTESYFEEKIRTVLDESLRIHLRSDVPVGAYVSGGLDSSIVAALASQHKGGDLLAFTGKFSLGEDYDESAYARELAFHRGFELLERDMTATDFTQNIRKLTYHMDYPVAGPGSFPQFMVSELAAKHRKVVLGGQGGDEIFGGYVRYLVAYFEQCIKAAIDGTAHNGKYIVTYESIIPNLTALHSYKPMLRDFWREGLFEERDRRYYRLVHRSTYADEVRWDRLQPHDTFASFHRIFWGQNVRNESYFDSMTHFDFKTLLPALLHVEDRVSMAHGLESRVPLLDHKVIELAATIPSNLKFKNGTMKHILREATRPLLPTSISDRKNKMGFPVPLAEWMRGDLNEFVRDIFSSSAALGRDLFDNRKVLALLDKEAQFGRKVWGLLCLELWQQAFHDREQEFKRMISQPDDASVELTLNGV